MGVVYIEIGYFFWKINLILIIHLIQFAEQKSNYFSYNICILRFNDDFDKFVSRKVFLGDLMNKNQFILAKVSFFSISGNQLKVMDSEKCIYATNQCFNKIYVKFKSCQCTSNWKIYIHLYLTHCLFNLDFDTTFNIL